jgi:SAM-dependent methyltransferase
MSAPEHTPSPEGAYGTADYARGFPPDYHRHFWHQARLAIVRAELVRLGGTCTVLDVGCGPGQYVRALRCSGYDAFGCDPGEISVDADLVGRVFGRTAAEGLPAAVRTAVDVVLLLDVLEHLVDPEATLQWLRQSLDSGGCLIASLPNSAHWYVRLNFLLGRIPEEDRGLFDRTHLHFYAWRNWESLLQRAGFVVEQVTPTVIPFDIVLPRLAGGRIVRALEATNFLLARLCGTFWAFQFVVVARPR